MNNPMIDKILEVIKQKNNFLIAAHINPEGDSIGSQMAFQYLLEKLNKNSVIVNNDPVPNNLKFLRGSENVLNEMPQGFNPEAVIILDCPVKERTGFVSEVIDKNAFIVNIDHHVSNEHFGDVNWVEDSASSVGEMMFFLIKKAGIKIEPEAAEMMYASIVTDTGCFNYENTSSLTHKTVAELIECGVSTVKMHNKIFENKSLDQTKLLGKVLSTLRTECGGKIAYMCLLKEFVKDVSPGSVITDEFINFARAVAGVEVAVFFKEKNNHAKQVNVSFRSNNFVNVDLIASYFGGGGHSKASGCLIDGDMEKAMKIVLAKVRETIEHTGE